MDKLCTNVALFHWTNNTELIKKIGIDRKPSAALERFSALGEIGRGAESFRPNSYSSNSQLKIKIRKKVNTQITRK